MNRITMTLLTVATAAVVAAPASARENAAETAKNLPAKTLPAKNIVETAVGAGSFTTLVAAVKAAGLAEALSGEGPFTVFAPTDAAFERLPEGTVATLLEPKSRDALTRILTFHVVPGRVMAADLLPAASSRTLAGDELGFGLRVENANVISADIACSNGVIHVIDAVLLPPVKNVATHGDAAVEAALVDAIDRGVPAFNDGDVDGCARIYRETARKLLGAADLADLHRMALTEALTTPAVDGEAEAWMLRRAFDGMLSDMAFEARIEAPLPEGFPGASPIGRVVQKEYPRYRAARAEGRSAFWSLFEHIKANDVKMTAPVEMTMDDGMQMQDMAFLYERPSQGEAGHDGTVAVLDLEPLKVLSIGMRGQRTEQALAGARKALEARLAADGRTATGPWRALGYNSPMVPTSQRYWELQVPIGD